MPSGLKYKSMNAKSCFIIFAVQWKWYFSKSISEFFRSDSLIILATFFKWWGQIKTHSPEAEKTQVIKIIYSPETCSLIIPFRKLWRLPKFLAETFYIWLNFLVFLWQKSLLITCWCFTCCCTAFSLSKGFFSVLGSTSQEVHKKLEGAWPGQVAKGIFHTTGHHARYINGSRAVSEQAVSNCIAHYCFYNLRFMTLFFVIFLFITTIITTTTTMTTMTTTMTTTTTTTILLYFFYQTVFISTHGSDFLLILLSIPHFVGLEGQGREQPCVTLLLVVVKLWQRSSKAESAVGVIF